MEKAKYQVEIDKYLNNPGNAYYLRIIGNRGYVLTSISQYITQASGELRDKLNVLYNNIDEVFYLEMTNVQLKEILFKSIGDKSNYYKHLYIFLYESDDVINQTIKENHIYEKDYVKMYNFFKKNFPNQENERKKLVRSYHKFIEPSSIEDLIEKSEGHRDRYEDRLVDLFLSNKSKIEYASDTGIRLAQVNNTVNRFLDDKKSKFHKMAVLVSKRSDEEIINKLKALANEIFLNEDLDILYFYDNTKLILQDFRDVIEPHFEKELVRTVLDRMSKLKEINNDVFKINEIEATTIIGGVEITSEEKANLFEYLETKNYPLGFYPTVLRKYAEGNLNIELDDSKNLIKK